MSRFLDKAGAADRAAIKAHAQQAQYDEYDDEYDDSYDDLGGPSADGVADVEGDTSGANSRSCMLFGSDMQAVIRGCAAT